MSVQHLTDKGHVQLLHSFWLKTIKSKHGTEHYLSQEKMIKFVDNIVNVTLVQISKKIFYQQGAQNIHLIIKNIMSFSSQESTRFQSYEIQYLTQFLIEHYYTHISLVKSIIYSNVQIDAANESNMIQLLIESPSTLCKQPLNNAKLIREGGNRIIVQQQKQINQNKIEQYEINQVNQNEKKEQEQEQIRV